MRRELDIHVSGFDPPRPIKTFGQAGFDHLLLGTIKRAGYDAPTAIQAQALPAVLSGRDVLVGLGFGRGWVPDWRGWFFLCCLPRCVCVSASIFGLWVS